MNDSTEKQQHGSTAARQHKILPDDAARLIITLILASIAISGCGKEPGPAKQTSADRRLTIVTTTGMLADAVKNIGGDRFNVVALMGPGVDPHLYKASEGDISRLASADVIVYNGLHLEGKMADVLVKMARDRIVIGAGALLPDSMLREPPEFLGQYDPHIWFGLDLWASMVEKLGAEFAAIDSLHKAAHLRRTAEYVSSIRALHQEIKDKINLIPDEQRVLITAHDAFGYFGEAYGVVVRGLQGISTVSEYGLMDVTNLVDFIVDRKIKAIFVESSVPARSIEAVQVGARERGHKVVIGGTLFSDAMGEAGTAEGTYLGMVRHNVDTIVSALR